jgi:hypothetical protein
MKHKINYKINIFIYQYKDSTQMFIFFITLHATDQYKQKCLYYNGKDNNLKSLTPSVPTTVRVK